MCKARFSHVITRWSKRHVVLKCLKTCSAHRIAPENFWMRFLRCLKHLKKIPFLALKKTMLTQYGVSDTWDDFSFLPTKNKKLIRGYKKKSKIFFQSNSFFKKLKNFLQPNSLQKNSKNFHSQIHCKKKARKSQTKYFFWG